MAHHSAYIDAEGRPRLRSSLVAFIDILGFSHASTTNLDDSQQVLDKIFDAIEASRAFVRNSLDSEHVDSSRWGIKFFSDNLALGYSLEETAEKSVLAATFIIRCVQQYQLQMALNGFFLRGALTQGPICLTDEIIFGAALVECYQLETKASIVPRIIMTDSFRNLLSTHAASGASQTASAAGDSICRDVDGWWFVNYLQAAVNEGEINWDFVARHKQSILDSLSTTTRHEVLPKFGWACRYHNVFCHWHRDAPGYSDRYRIDRADEHSTILRPGDVSEGAK